LGQKIINKKKEEDAAIAANRQRRKGSVNANNSSLGQKKGGFNDSLAEGSFE